MKRRHLLCLGLGVGGTMAVLMFSLMACSTSAKPASGSGEIWGITDFPEASSFTEDIVNLPNPFISWHGNEVSAENWDLRREEISQILQHYMLGYKHPDEGFASEIVSVGTGGAEQLVTFKVTRKETGINGEFYAKVAIPSGVPPVDGWPVIMTVNMSKYTGDLGTPNANNAYINEAGFVHLSVWMYNICGTDQGQGYYPVWDNAGINDGMVPKLFPEVDYWGGTGQVRYDDKWGRYDTRYGWLTHVGDPDAPGLQMNWVWGISRLIDALEADNAKSASERQLSFNTTKIAITGMSRMGKLTLFAGAFEPRLSVICPADTCGGGFNIDRFVSVAVNEADSRRNIATHYLPEEELPPRPADGRSAANWAPYNMDKTTFGPFDGYGPLNKTYTYLKYESVGAGNIINARKVTAKEALANPTITPDGGVTVDFRPNNDAAGHVIWKGLPTGEVGSVMNIVIDNNATNLRDGYGVHEHYTAFTSGGVVAGDYPWAPQTLPDIRWGFPNYWNARFHQIPLIYPDLSIHGRVDRGDWGYFSNTPWDAHFITSLIAPRPLLMVGGFNSENSGMEGAFLSFLATREVYRLLGAEDNIGIHVSVHQHTHAPQEYRDLVDTCVAYWGGGVMPERLRPDSVEEYPYPINDPRSRYDYVKLDWAAPGYESIADIVERLVPANATNWDEIDGIPNN